MMIANQPHPAQSDGDALKKYRLLADRLRWIYEQRSIDLPLAGEVLKKLPEIISGLDALVATSPARDAAEGGDDQDPPRKWVINCLRDLARELLADPKTPWIGERDPKQHICWTAANWLEAAPPKPAPDASNRLQIETERADENGRSCSGFYQALRLIFETTADPKIEKIAQDAMRMPWLTNAKPAPATMREKFMYDAKPEPAAVRIEQVERLVCKRLGYHDPDLWHPESRANRLTALAKELLDLAAPVPPADGATEEALTKLLDEAWPDGHRAAARKILSRFSMVPSATGVAEPVAAWVIPGSDTADANGFISGMAFKDGEFTKPLYATPPVKGEREADQDRLIAIMALALQTAQTAFKHPAVSSVAQAAALSSITIALNMEAEHWQKCARLSCQPPQSRGDTEPQ